MKKIILNKVFWFLLNWLRSRLTERSVSKPKFGNMKRHKKLSPKHIHLLRVAQLLKDNFRQKAWTKH